MTDTRLDWCPPRSDTVSLLPAGRDWDAVRADAATARWAFPILSGPHESAAIVDPYTCSTYWLLPPGEAHDFIHWQRLHPHVTVLPARPGIHYVGVPPAHRRTGPGLHWHVPHNWSGRYLTEPAYLAAALTPAVHAAHGPHNNR
ncbi:hypothetical protein [Streptomyces youssoufiensis]